jgi:DNA-binding response OmpR family regulator
LGLLFDTVIHIAVIDDHQEVIHLLAGWLQELLPSVKVHTYQTLDAALAALATTEFDLVVADVDLGPGSDRFGGARIARALDTQQTPLLVVSGSTDVELQAGFFDALDAWDYLQKPVSRLDFEREVRRAIAFRRGSGSGAVRIEGTFARVPDLKITRRTGCPVEWKGKTVRMPMSKIDIVEMLARSAGEVVLHDALIECIPTGRNKENLRVKISEIREVFEAEDPEFDRIVTVPLKGYLWRVD